MALWAAAGRRSQAGLLACALAFLPAYAADGNGVRHYFGEFHGFRVRVMDRTDKRTGRTMREVTLSAKDNVVPFSIYGMRYVGESAGYHLGIVRHDRHMREGCAWSASGTPQGIERCTEEQIAQYTRQLDHAIDDVVR